MSEVISLQRVTAENEATWERLEQASADHTFFSGRLWLDALEEAGTPVTRYLVESDGLVLAGLAASSAKRRLTPLPVTPYAGLLLSVTGTSKRSKQESTLGRVVQAISTGLAAEHDEIILSLPPTLADIRPFQWAGYAVRPRYTYVIPPRPVEELWQRMDDNLRRAIRRAGKVGVRLQTGWEAGEFWELYSKTHLRKGLGLPLSKTALSGLLDKLTTAQSGKLFLASGPNGRPAAAALVVWDNRRAYYLLGGSDPQQNHLAAPSFLHWEIVKELSARNLAYDMLGANTPSVVAFKIGFNPELELYHEVTKVTGGALAFRRALQQVARSGKAALKELIRTRT